MVQEIVVGTLSALSTLVSPLGPASLAERQSYHFSLAAQEGLRENCTLAAGNHPRQARSELDVRFENLTPTHFTAVLSLELCTGTSRYRTATERMNLPIQLLDEDFLLGLPLKAPYVISGIPARAEPGQKHRLKITRLRSVGDLNPVRLEWIPEKGQEPAHSPLTIWIAREQSSFTGVSGFSAKTLKWRRLELTYGSPLLQHPLAMVGELSRIEQEQ